jgi:hypothetical protein
LLLSCLLPPTARGFNIKSRVLPCLPKIRMSAEPGGVHFGVRTCLHSGCVVATLHTDFVRYFAHKMQLIKMLYCILHLKERYKIYSSGLVFKEILRCILVLPLKCIIKDNITGQCTPSLLQTLHILKPQNMWYHRWNARHTPYIKRHIISAHHLKYFKFTRRSFLLSAA